MRYRRMPIEIESPEQLGYSVITNNLSESLAGLTAAAEAAPGAVER